MKLKSVMLFLAGMLILAMPDAYATPPDFIVDGEFLVEFHGDIRGKEGSDVSANRGTPAVPKSLADAGILSLEPLFRPMTAGPKSTSPRLPHSHPYLYLARVAPGLSRQQAVEALNRIPGVLRVEPNYTGSLSFTPADELYPLTATHFSQIGLEAGWDIQAGGSADVLVAVVDSGIDTNHLDFDGVIHSSSYDFVSESGAIFDDLGHGTRVSGIAGAVSDSSGIAGVAFGSRILSLDVVDATGIVTTARVIEALDYAVAQGADVINLSLSFFQRSQFMAEAVERAADRAVLVASAGNENQGDQPVYPASFPEVIGVGATERSTTSRAPFSNYNGGRDDLVELVAPGVTLFTTIPGSLYDGQYTSGTSFAAPLVSGVAALLRSRYPEQSARGIRHHLIRTAQPLQPWAGYGLVRADTALSQLPVPSLRVAAVTVLDSTALQGGNDADGAWDQGETVDVRVTLANSGSDVFGLTATAATADAEVTVLENSLDWGDIRAEETVPSTLNLRLSAEASAAHSAPFTLSLSGNSGAYTESLPLSLQIEDAQILAATSYFTPQTWTADKTWEIHGTQNFARGGLTVEPGTVIKLAPGADLLFNDGSVSAEGTAEDPITFTSLQPLGVSGLPAATTTPLGPRTVPVDTASYSLVRYVSASTGSDLTGNGTRTNPWRTVEHAMTQLPDTPTGDPFALLVAQGTYAPVAFNHNAHVYGGFSTAWERDIEQYPAIFDGNHQEPAGLVENDNVRIDGCRFIHGHNSERSGAGLLTILAQDLVLSNNVFTNNRAQEGGNGLAVSADCIIENNLFVGNTSLPSAQSDYGGAIRVFTTARVLIRRNVIAGNSAHEGGGIGSHSSPDITVEQNLFSNNDASRGGALYTFIQDSRLLNSLPSI